MAREAKKIARVSVPQAVRTAFDVEDAEGVALLAMTRASEKCHDLSEAYLHRVGQNAVFRAISQVASGPRDMQRPLSLESEAENPSIFSLAATDDNPSDALTTMITSELIETLPTERQRRVMAGLFLNGQSRADVAQELGCSVDAVKELRKRAIIALRTNATMK